MMKMLDSVAVANPTRPQDFCRARPSFNGFITGRGFANFRRQFPELCESSDLKSPTSPCSDASEEDRHQTNGSIKSMTPLSMSASWNRLSLPFSLSQPCLADIHSNSNVPASCPASATSSPEGPTKILDFLYLGSQNDALDPQVIEKYKITKVINLSESCPKPDSVADDIQHFLRIPIKDSYCAKLLPHFETAYAFLEDARQRNEKVLVHCLAGISRSATLAIAYIMRSKGLASDEAYKFVKALRPSISPNFNFMGQLLEYEKQLREKHLIPAALNRSHSITKCSQEVSDRWASEPPPEPVLINDKLCKSASSDFVLLTQSSRNFYTNQNGKRTMDSPLALPERPRQLMRSPPRKSEEETLKPNAQEDLPSPSTELAKLDLSLVNPWFDAHTTSSSFSSTKNVAEKQTESMIENPMFGIFPGPSTSKPNVPAMHKTKSDTCVVKKASSSISATLGPTFRSHCKSSFFRCMMRRPPASKQTEPKKEATTVELSRPKLRRLPLLRSHFEVLPSHEEHHEEKDSSFSPNTMDDSLRDSAYGDSLPRSSTEDSSQQSSLSISLSVDSPESGFVDNYSLSTNPHASHPVSPFQETATTASTNTTDPYHDPERESIGSSSSLEIAVN
uniref:protein-tyrosine-phosphatase n=1 Tax=Acrobeloides nanus TaxID=290746 RepID=A0A914DID7_9BILA